MYNFTVISVYADMPVPSGAGISAFTVMTKSVPHTVYLCDRYLMINSLLTSDSTWRHRIWATLVRVMACCLTAPNRYLDRCWLIISDVFTLEYSHRKCWEIYVRKFLIQDNSQISRANELGKWVKWSISRSDLIRRRLLCHHWNFTVVWGQVR